MLVSDRTNRLLRGLRMSCLKHQYLTVWSQDSQGFQVLEMLQLLWVGLQPFLLPGITAAPAPGPPEAAVCPETSGCSSWAMTTSLPRQPGAEIQHFLRVMHAWLCGVHSCWHPAVGQSARCPQRGFLHSPAPHPTGPWGSKVVIWTLQALASDPQLLQASGVHLVAVAGRAGTEEAVARSLSKKNVEPIIMY